MNIQILAGPLIGAIIGYITNYIAIKMLFRPLEAKYIFGIKVPFTPGIIPRRKYELADALGKAVFKRFFGWDDLAAVLLSDAFADKISEGIEDCINKTDPKELLERVPFDARARIRNVLSEQVRHSMVVNGYAGLAKIASETAGDMIDNMAQKITREEFSEMVSGITAMDKVELRPYIKNIYKGFMEKYVRDAVESVDMIGMVSDKLKTMDPGDIEVLALDIVDRELKMVVRFGAVLGALIGAVNSLIYLL